MTTRTETSAITAYAYAEFIQRVVAARGGDITDRDLNALIEEKYGPDWMETDSCRGAISTTPSGSRTWPAPSRAWIGGIIVKFKAGRIIWRVALPEAFLVNAILHVASRKGGRGREAYEPLAQPKGRHVVPEIV